MFKKIYAKVAGIATAGTAVGSLATAAFAQVMAPDSAGLYGFADINDAIASIMNLVFFFALILVLIYLIWGGIQWITSGGDKAGTEAARGKITGAIVGIIVVAVAYAIYVIIAQFVGIAPGSEVQLRQEV